MTSVALDRRRAIPLAPPARLAAGTMVETSAGSVSAFFALEGFDRRRGVATYVLRVVNRTESSLICRTWMISRDGDAVPAYPASFAVEPLSSRSASVPVWPRDVPAFDRAIAEVVGEGVQCLVEAAAPPVRKARGARAAIAAACVAAGGCMIAVATALGAAVPRISAVAVAPQTMEGTTVEAEYSTAGVGSLAYVVTGPDGRRLAGARLRSRSGSIFVPIPAGTQAGAYSLRLAMDGPLGSASETRIVNALPAKASSAAIGEIAVKPMVVQPGQSVGVSYSADGDGGYIRLEGTDGTVWAQEPYSREGQSHLIVPPVAEGRELHVVLHVTKGNSTAQTAAGILVAGAPQTVAPAASGPAIQGDDDPTIPAANGSDANGTFDVENRSVQSGGGILIKILSPRNGMHIALLDAQSHEVTGADVGSDATTLTLRAPKVNVATRYTVVASFTDGFGEESIVQPVTVLP